MRTALQRKHTFCIKVGEREFAPHTAILLSLLTSDALVNGSCFGFFQSSYVCIILFRYYCVMKAIL